MLIAVLALAVHTFVNNKYVGHFVVLLVFLVTSRLADLGFEDRLYRYASRPDVIYSDLNGYGHFLPAVIWFRVYWGAFAVMLLVLAYALWVRGRDGGWRGRWRAAAARMTPAAWSVAGAAAAAFVGSGAWIFYNTHVINAFLSRDDAQRIAAEYEKKFKPLAMAPQPKVTAADVRVDIQPARQQARIAGTLTTVNRTDQPIRDLYLLYPRSARVQKIEFSAPAKLAESLPEMRWHHYVLDAPLAPGATMDLVFDLEYGARGFRNDGADPVVLANGTFLNPGPDARKPRSFRASATTKAPSSPPTTIAASSGWRRSRACPTSTTTRGSSRARSRATRTSSRTARRCARRPTSCR